MRLAKRLRQPASSSQGLSVHLAAGDDHLVEARTGGGVDAEIVIARIPLDHGSRRAYTQRTRVIVIEEFPLLDANKNGR
jgi:hypothetical protein